MSIYYTCVTHIIAIRRVLIGGDSTGIIDGSWIMTDFRFGCWCSVSTEISCFHGWGGLLQGHITEPYLDKHVYTLQLSKNCLQNSHWASSKEKIWQGYLTWVITGIPLAHPLEDMVQSQDVAHLMDHGVLVTHGTKVGWVQHHST